ncbi:hypothetical protein STEG23_028426 [Scotinomys teguina]
MKKLPHAGRINAIPIDQSNVQLSPEKLFLEAHGNKCKDLQLDHVQCDTGTLNAEWEGQISNGYKQNMTYKVAVRLSTSPCIKPGQGDPLIP